MLHHLKRYQFRESAREYLPDIIIGQIISIVGGLAAGGLLAYFRGSFEPVVGFLILLPGVIDGTGNIQGSLAARLNHTVLRWPKFHESRRAWTNNQQSAYILGGALGIVLGALAVILSYILYSRANFNLFWIALVSCTAANAILTPLISRLTDRWFDLGHNPDNVMGPIVTSLADITGIVVLGVTIYLFF